MPATSSPAEDAVKVHEAKFLCLLTSAKTHSFNSVYGIFPPTISLPH